MSGKQVECGEHGTQEATFVCQHLVHSLQSGEAVGFHWSPSEDTTRGDAWCSACEAERIRCGGDWNDESEAFAGISLLCGACYDRVREINGR
jgi:hypothetical protein